MEMLVTHRLQQAVFVVNTYTRDAKPQDPLQLYARSVYLPVRMV